MGELTCLSRLGFGVGEKSFIVVYDGHNALGYGHLIAPAVRTRSSPESRRTRVDPVSIVPKNRNVMNSTHGMYQLSSKIAGIIAHRHLRDWHQCCWTSRCKLAAYVDAWQAYEMNCSSTTPASRTDADAMTLCTEIC